LKKTKKKKKTGRVGTKKKGGVYGKEKKTFSSRERGGGRETRSWG